MLDSVAVASGWTRVADTIHARFSDKACRPSDRCLIHVGTDYWGTHCVDFVHRVWLSFPAFSTVCVSLLSNLSYALLAQARYD